MPLTIDGITALSVIGIASFGIDRLVTGTLFLLSFSPTWRRFFPPPDTIVDQQETDNSIRNGPRILVPFGMTPVESQKRATQLPAKLKRSQAKRRLKLAYYALAAAVGGIVLAYFGEIRIFRAVGFDQTPATLDCIFTGLIVTAGSDTMSKLKFPALSQADNAMPGPVQVTGSLSLNDSGRLRSAG